jgi:hypothetical protein
MHVKVFNHNVVLKTNRFFGFIPLRKNGEHVSPTRKKTLAFDKTRGNGGGRKKEYQKAMHVL